MVDLSIIFVIKYWVFPVKMVIFHRFSLTFTVSPGDASPCHRCHRCGWVSRQVSLRTSACGAGHAIQRDRRNGGQRAPLGRIHRVSNGFVWKCCVPHCTQWFCWSLSLWKMAISLGIYPTFSDQWGIFCKRHIKDYMDSMEKKHRKTHIVSAGY